MRSQTKNLSPASLPVYLLVLKGLLNFAHHVSSLNDVRQSKPGYSDVVEVNILIYGSDVELY